MTQGGRADAAPHPTRGRARCDLCTVRVDTYLEGFAFCHNYLFFGYTPTKLASAC